MTKARTKTLDILEAVRNDARYKLNVTFGRPRPGHAEGTVKAHIDELQRNLTELRKICWLSQEHVEKLMLLIHVHDSFKAESLRDVSIDHARSHATIARNYLAHFTDDEDLLVITQYHDLGFALYQKIKQGKPLDEKRMRDGLLKIGDIDLFLAFAIVDACTASKGREAITWWVKEVRKVRPEATVLVDHILPGPNLTPRGEW